MTPEDDVKMLREVAAPGEALERILDRLEAAEKDAARYEWLRRRVPGGTYRIMGVIYSEGGAGVDAAIDAAMKGQP